MRDEIPFWSDIKKKGNPPVIVKHLQPCSANPRGVGVIPILEMA